MVVTPDNTNKLQESNSPRRKSNAHSGSASNNSNGPSSFHLSVVLCCLSSTKSAATVSVSIILLTSVILFKQDPTRHFNNTVNGMKNILEFAKKNSIKKLIYPSSASVYAKNSPPHTENIIPKPSNPYGSAKVECENLAHSYNDTVNSIGLRIFAVYGPGEETKQNLSSVINLWLEDARNNNEPVIFGDGTQTRDFIYIDDVISAIINSSQLSRHGIINVGSGIATSFNQIIEKIGDIMGRKINPTYVKKDTNYVKKLQADTKLMENTVKINPLSIEIGISKFAKYLNII